MDERITKYFLEQLPEAERTSLLKERETNKELKEDFATIQNLQAMTHLTSSSINKEEGEEKFAQIEKNIKRKRIWSIGKNVARYAAAITITFIISWFSFHTRESVPELVASQQELYVPAGQRARITLPDGSIAWLNAGSTLLYPSYFDKERKVELIGEGFFEVAKDMERPFIVSTGEVEVKALGTQFNVYNYPKANYLSATLTEGSILVYLNGKEKSGQILEPFQRLILENGKFRLEKDIDMDELLWKEGIYSFKKQRMSDIIAKLELYFDVEIIVNNPRILNYEYTGKFRQRDGVLEILRIIQKIHRFTIDSNEDRSKITLS